MSPHRVPPGAAPRRKRCTGSSTRSTLTSPPLDSPSGAAGEGLGAAKPNVVTGEAAPGLLHAAGPAATAFQRLAAAPAAAGRPGGVHSCCCCTCCCAWCACSAACSASSCCACCCAAACQAGGGRRASGAAAGEAAGEASEAKGSVAAQAVGEPWAGAR
mgnify:CR=1 FL=1